MLSRASFRGRSNGSYERNSENPLYSRVFGVLYLESTQYRGGLHFMDFLERMEMLRLFVIVLCVEIPLHKPVSEAEKDQLLDAMFGDRGYIRIFRKAFVIRGDTTLVVFDHVIDIRFIRNQACEVLAQVAPSGCIPVNECDFTVGIDQVGHPEVPVA